MADEEGKTSASPKPVDEKAPSPVQNEQTVEQTEAEQGAGDTEPKGPTADAAGRQSKSPPPVADDAGRQATSPVEKEAPADDGADENQNAGGEDQEETKQEEKQGLSFLFIVTVVHMWSN